MSVLVSARRLSALDGAKDTSTFNGGSSNSNVHRECRTPQRSNVFGKLHRLLVVLTVLLCIGCRSEDTGHKASHFEHDHEVAEHWPNDLSDAASKIRERLVWIRTGEIPEHDDHGEEDHGEEDQHHDDHPHEPKAEIIDLVSWVPEIAADTNLSEADWVPLYNASESLMANLRVAGEGLSSESQNQIESLCRLIDDALPKIPEQFASLKVTSP